MDVIVVVAVPDVKRNYSTRRPSLSSISLSSSIDLRSPPLTPLSPPTPMTLPTPPVVPSVTPAPSAETVRAQAAQAQNSSAKVLAQSDNLTQFETDLLPTLLSKQAKASVKVFHIAAFY